MDELFICGAAFIVLATSKSPGSHLESIIINFLNCPDHSVQCHCHDAQKTDREDKPIHFEHLTGIDNEVSQAVSCCKKFSDDYTYQTKADVHFHIADDRGYRTGEHDLEKGVLPVPMQGVDQFDLFPVHGRKAGIQIHDAAEYCHGHAGYDNSGRGGAQPHDEKRGQRRLGQAVEDDQIGFQDFRQTAAAPEQHSGKNADYRHKQETDDGFIQGDANVEKDGPVFCHFIKAEHNPERAAEDKGIDDPVICAYFPEQQEEDQDEDSCAAHGSPAAAQPSDETFLTGGGRVSGYLLLVVLNVHRGSTPSIFR